MKKHILLITLLVIIGNLIISCSDMNDMHDVYLREGEKTYIGKVDSIKVYSGRYRVKIDYWITDPRAKELHVFWNQMRDSLVVDIPIHNPEDRLSFVIGNNNEVLSEGDHTLFFYSFDNNGHKSIRFESLVNVYGERYQESLINRTVTGVDIINNNYLAVNWGRKTNNEELGVLISYYDKKGNLNDTLIFSEILDKPVIFEEIDFTKAIFYKTLFLPDEFAIDTFSTIESESIKVTVIENVALNKKTVVSDMLDDRFPGDNAVDGIITSDSRWVSSDKGEHWIEVDLGGLYPIQKIKTYNGSGNSPNMAIKNFMFQIDVDGEWLTILNITDNTEHTYEAIFDEVITDKVRFFVPDYPDNMVRLFELEVYSIITFN